jgi:hypothetical protein
MLIFKSVIAGIALSTIALLMLYGIGIVLVLRKHQPGVGWDPVRALSLPGFVIYLTVSFLVGFLFTYRHIRIR